MKCLYWNARGLANSPTRSVLKKFCFTHNPDFLFIAEPWLPFTSFPDKFWKKLKLKLIAINDRDNLDSNLWCLCKEEWNPCVTKVSDQYVSFSIMVDGISFGISAVYASTSYVKRRSLWSDLNSLQHSYQIPWCFMGDYNTVLGAHEYRGNGLPSRIFL